MSGCMVCGQNPDGIELPPGWGFVCWECTTRRTAFVAKLERETKIEIRNAADYAAALDRWDHKQKSLALNEELKSVRKSLGYSQSTMAVFLGVTQSFYAKMENGHKPLNQKALRLVEERRVNFANTNT